MNHVRPTSLKDIIGQTNVKIILETLIESTNQQKNKPLPHLLFHGSAGTGKTTFAKVCALEKGRPLIDINAASIKTIDDIDNILVKFREHKESNLPVPMWFIDEIHTLPNIICEYLYPIMEDFEVHSQGSVIPTPEFTIIGATTKIGNIPYPLLSRFKHDFELIEYTEQELMKIVCRIGNLYGIDFKEDLAKVVSKVSRGVPRKIVAIVEWLIDYARAKRLTSLNVDKALHIIKLKGIDEEGFTESDYRYLAAVKKYAPVSLLQLSHILGIDKITIQNNIEPFLIKQGKVDIMSKGRILTGQSIVSNNLMSLC